MLKLLVTSGLTLALAACTSPEQALSGPASRGGPADGATVLGPSALDEVSQAPSDASLLGDVAGATHGEAHAGENGTDQRVRLSFEPGTSQVTVRDTLGRGALHDYRLRASAGQTLTATLRSDGPPTILVMDDEGFSPTAVRPLDWTVNEAVTQPAGWRWQGALPHDGVYWIRVAHSGPAANGGAWSPYALTVEIR